MYISGQRMKRHERKEKTGFTIIEELCCLFDNRGISWLWSRAVFYYFVYNETTTQIKVFRTTPLPFSPSQE